MKQKMLLVIFPLMLLVSILAPKETFAISSSGGYTIESYNINMIVNENNTFDITETISVNFTSYGKHGIYRKIPLKNKVERLDGTKSTNNAKISNISVNDDFTTSNEYGYKVIKIGNASQTVSGKKIYTIKYRYNIGKDPLKDADELYFNLIGTKWDVSINNISFTITMPKTFDQSKLGFSSGYNTSENSSNVTYTISGNTITGFLEGPLHPGQALTIRLTLPEGYFVGASSNFDYVALFKIATSISFVIIAYIIWNKSGKDKMVIDTVEFYPPDNLNSAEVGFIYKGISEKKDVISLLIYLADKGYLKIEEYKEKGFYKDRKTFKIVKVKEYDGDNEDEKTFFYGLFNGKKLKDGVTLEELNQTKGKISINDLYDSCESKEEVTEDDLYNRFYITLIRITKNINRKENQEKIFEKSSLGKRGIILAMITIVFLMMEGWSVIKLGDMRAIIMILFLLFAPLVLLYKQSSLLMVIVSSLSFVYAGFGCMVIEEGDINISILIQFIIHSVCMIALIIFFAIIRKRTEYGTEMLGKIQGFKNFLKTVEKPRLEQLVMENPEYFYNVLPYTYVLGISRKWMKKFEDIALEAPTWYHGYTNFSAHSFNTFMKSTYSSISNTMTSRLSGSGRGFSGRGSGGGGGGSW